MFALNIYKRVQTYQKMMRNAKSVPYSTEYVLRMIPGKRKNNNALLYETSVSIVTCSVLALDFYLSMASTM
jgi:hypothetical protein